MLQEIVSEYGSMDTYITSVPPEALVRDLSVGRHQLYEIGPALAWEYLRNVGIDGVKPDYSCVSFSGSRPYGKT